jgi:hypothetical protein
VMKDVRTRTGDVIAWFRPISMEMKDVICERTP